MRILQLGVVLLILFISFTLKAESCLSSSETIKSAVSIPEPRIALVMGNSKYIEPSLPPTPNAENDARDMAKALKRAGFEVVCGVNLDRKSMLDLTQRFIDRLDEMGSEAVSLFYYAGHGVQLNATNYLLPVDAKPDENNPELFDTQAINLDTIIGMLVDANNDQGSRFIMLDACRDNPFGKGWGKPKVQFSIKGLYWTFGTGYGQFAADGSGRNGLFTKHFLKHMFTKGATFEQVMKNVTAGVSHESNGSQVPEVGGSLINDFQFVPGQRINIKNILIDTPLWEKSLYWTALVLLLLVSYGLYSHRQATAWTRGIDLTDKLTIDPKVAEEVRQKSRLATDEIVGYCKDIKNNRLLALVTPKYNLVMGRNSNVNVVFKNDSVSGEHAQLGWDKDKKQFWLEDMGSTNGTWWGKGKQLKAGQRVQLKSGQLFYLADQDTAVVVIAHVDKNQ